MRAACSAVSAGRRKRPVRSPVAPNRINLSIMMGSSRVVLTRRWSTPCFFPACACSVPGDAEYGDHMAIRHRSWRPDDAVRVSAGMNRREFVSRAALASAAMLVGGDAVAQSRPESPVAKPAPATDRRGSLHPQQNHFRNLLDISGLWQFQLDPKEEGESQRWFNALPSSRIIPVPCSWNDLFDDARDYLGVAWYGREVYVPSAWRGQRIFLRIGSANYAAKVWVNGKVVATHFGGHLPFLADISGEVAWDRPNVIAITVENKQLPDRVPPGPAGAGAGVFGTMAPYPATTYDFFPYAGLHRPVLLCAVPTAAHIDDITVTTSIEGRDGVVN